MGKDALRAVACAAVIVLGAPAAAEARPPSTAVQTIVDSNTDNLLDAGPGDPHVLRTELGTPTAGADPLELLFFGQLTDTHVVDEESPLRVEFTDKLGLVFTAAYRAQEGLSAQVLDQMVDQLRNTVSPITQRRLDLVVATGDNTDNTQCNETRWFVDLLDGGGTVDPDSGLQRGQTPNDGDLCRSEASAPVNVPTPPNCELPPDAGRYDGVRGDGEYYEPDRSGAGEDGTGYSPDQAENGRPVASRDFPGLFEAMNTPFRAVGLRSSAAGDGDNRIPWYSVFGNHDGLVQGNAPRNPLLEAYAVGCLKVTGLSAAQQAAVAGAGSKADAMGAALAATLANAAAGDSVLTTVVPPDPRRRPLTKREFIAEHFRTGGLPVGHGFTPQNLADGMGYYTFHPRPGVPVRFVALDTISEHGLEDGNLDDTQFRWLHAQLSAAEAAHELVVVFGHHSLRTMGQPPVSPFLPGDGYLGAGLDPNVHFGEGLRNTGVSLPCLNSSPGDPPYPTETVKCLFLRHRSVIAFVNGHEHANRVTPYPRRNALGGADGGFWEINTASHIDWPQQSRVIDLVDNRDGTLTLFGTLVDDAAPLRPGEGAGYTPRDLAAISRELAFNDPQGAATETGEGGSRGKPEDRNVRLIVKNPYGT